jgi:hypothetical protein
LGSCWKRSIVKNCPVGCELEGPPFDLVKMTEYTDLMEGCEGTRGVVPP